MQFLSQELRCALIERINSTIDLPTVLDVLGAEIEKQGIIDGYLINLHDSTSSKLISLKIRFIPEFQSLEDTYYGYAAPLKGTELNVSARAYMQRQIVRVDHETGAHAERQILNLWKLEEIAAVPLLENGDASTPPIGTILLLREHGHIDDDCLQVMQELLNLFYRPLRNALEYSFLKEHQARYEAAAAEHARFLQFIIEMNNLTSPEKIYEMFSDELFRQMPFNTASFYLVDQGLLVNQKISVNDPQYQTVTLACEQYLRDTPYLLQSTDGGAPHALLKNAAFVFPDVQKIAHLPMSTKDRQQLSILKSTRTLLLLPIRYQNQPIGVLTLSSLAEVVPVSESDLHLMEHLSSFLGTAITNGRNYALSQEQNREIARLNLILEDKVAELAEQAATDRLTGLYNFRIFEEELGRRINEYERSTDKHGLSIAIIDIDHFKRFNDSYGHAAGNVVLAGVAKEITKLARKMDLACRYGGEEFVVIMAKCELEGAKVFSERMRAAIEAATFETDAGTLSVTVSIGCATRMDDDSQDSLFKRADQALYSAKNSGRNRIVAL